LIIRFKEGIIKRLKGILPLELGLKMLHNPGKLPRPYGRGLWWKRWRKDWVILWSQGERRGL